MMMRKTALALALASTTALAQSATLTAAAATGAPFCEECARARAAGA